MPRAEALLHLVRVEVKQGSVISVGLGQKRRVVDETARLDRPAQARPFVQGRVSPGRQDVGEEVVGNVGPLVVVGDGGRVEDVGICQVADELADALDLLHRVPPLTPASLRRF